MGKVELNKLQKKNSLLETAFDLFTSKGLNNTSISDIVEKAGVAKGTFYLYFKDKYDIHQKLIVHKSTQLFDEALDELARHTEIETLSDKIIFLVNTILDALTENKTLLVFIAKDLGLGFFHSALHAEVISENQFHQVYQALIDQHGAELRDPEIMLYLIIELVGSSCYTSILYNEPVPIDELKKHLAATIKNIIDSYTI